MLVGINLLREGLDLPEVSLVAILDADKEGFLRSETCLIQTIGRAARNARAWSFLYADKVTPSMARPWMETERRRAIQDAYNQAHGIVPKTIRKEKIGPRPDRDLPCARCRWRRCCCIWRRPLWCIFSAVLWKTPLTKGKLAALCVVSLLGCVMVSGIWAGT